MSTPQRHLPKEYSKADRQLLYDLIAKPDCRLTGSLFKLMVRPGDLMLVKHNKDSGELYFLTGDPAVENPIGSVKILGPSDIDNSNKRTEGDVEANGLVVMTLNRLDLLKGLTTHDRSQNSLRILMKRDWPLWEFKGKPI